MTATLKLINLQNPSSASPNIVLNADGSTTIPTQSTTNLAYTGTLTGGTGVINIGSGQVYKDASGNVGIGTALPEYKVDLNGAAGVGIQIFETSTGTNKRLRLLQNSTGVLYDATFGSGGNAHVFAVAGSERMRIDSSGNLLVGTTAPGFSNTTSFVLDKGGGYFIVNHSNTSSGTAYVLFGYNNTGIGSITQNGTTGVSYNTSSDYRLKENVAPMQNALATVAALKPVTYTWKADGSTGQGFIAHELQAVVPDCVTGTKDAVDKDGKPQYQGVDTSFLVATLVSAIQELKAEFDAYKLSHP